MPAPSDEPLIKITLNLYDADVTWFKHKHGAGYSGEIREVIRKHVREQRVMPSRPVEQFLEEDFDE